MNGDICNVIINVYYVFQSNIYKYLSKKLFLLYLNHCSNTSNKNNTIKEVEEGNTNDEIKAEDTYETNKINSLDKRNTNGKIQ